MKLVNKTRYAVLGMLLDGPSTGYEMKSLMKRSTVYFWRESDSTLYPMLKVLAKEGKVQSEIEYVGKKKKEIYSITSTGRAEFKTWFESPTGCEIPRNEFLLKLFFVTERGEMIRLFRERLAHVASTFKEYKRIEKRLESLAASNRQAIRLKALQYGTEHMAMEIAWLKENSLDDVHE